MTTSARARSIDVFFREPPRNQHPTRQPDTREPAGKVLTAAEILDKGTRSVEAITVIAVVVGLTVGGYALWRAIKAKAEQEEQEEAMIAALVEEEVMKERGFRPALQPLPREGQ